jgi:hypothetical protein
MYSKTAKKSIKEAKLRRILQKKVIFFDFVLAFLQNAVILWNY